MSAWKEAKADDGRAYYYNATTRETRWEKPEDFDAAAAPVTPATPQADPAAIDAAWKEAKAKDDRTYYYNSITRETRWEQPPGFQKAQAVARPSAPAFVAGGAQNPHEDGYGNQDRRRDRRDDRDHALPQRPNFESRGGDRPWEQRHENTGFRGPMPAKSDEPEYATPEQAEEAFFKMLRKQNISPDLTWEDALGQVIREREYRAFKDPQERKQAFEKYRAQTRELEKGKEKERREKLREDYRKMLTAHDEIKYYTRWRTARSSIEREAVFKSVGNEDLRRQMFDEYIFELKRKHAEAEETKHYSALQDLDALFSALIDDPNVKWKDAHDSITSNERFANDDKFRTLSNLDVLNAYDRQIRALGNAANEEKQRSKRLHTRRERQARDGYRELLRQLQSQGKIKANTQWKDLHSLIAQDERYTRLIGNPGSNPLDLFWDIAEEEDQKLRSLRGVALDVLEDVRYEMTLDTTLADFTDVMYNNSRTGKFSEQDVGLIYEKLMGKIKERTEKDRMANERSQRKAVDSLRSVIKHLDPPVRLSDSYEDVMPRLQVYEEFTLLNDDVARRAAFDKHMKRLKEKEEDVEPVRAHRERDREHRNGSRRDYDRDRERRHRTRTPEVDAYEADRRKAQTDRERLHRKASFGLTPPRGDRREDRDDRYRRNDRQEGMSHYDRERREREMERERSYISRADPRDKGRTLDYGDEDAMGSRSGSIRKRRESDGSGAGRRDPKRLRRGHTRTPEAETMLKDESPALQSGSEEGEIEEV